MMSPAEHHDAAMAEAYAELCMAADLEAAIWKLTHQRVYDLVRWLAMQGITTGVPGLVAGMLDLSRQERFMKLMEEQGGRA